MTAAAPTAHAAPPEVSTDWPSISVVVPVRNEGRHIRRTLEWLLSQDYPGRFEVIVADGDSDDSTADIVFRMQEDCDRLVLLHNPKRWSSAARNLGVRHASGDVIVVVDGHCDVSGRGYLRALAEAFARSGADCLARPQPLEVRGASPLQRAVAAARSSFAGHNPSSHIYDHAEGFVDPQSSAAAYRREVFDRVGLFDESFDACEDVEFNTRVRDAGLTCFTSPDVKIAYYPRTTLNGVFRQMFRYGVGRASLTRKHPATLGPACLAPPGLVASLTLTAVVGLWWQPAAWAFAAVAAAYALFVGSGTVAARLWRDPRALAWLPAVFAAVHFGFGCGFLTECGRSLVRRRTR